MLSIIVPIYNVEEYLDQFFQSLISQPSDNFELICVNDGSTDSSFEILKKYSKKFDNIFIINQLNSGVSKARNNGLKKARGEYVVFLDSDDFLESNYIEKINELILRSKNSDLIIYGSNYIYNNGLIKKNKSIGKTSYISNKQFGNSFNFLFRRINLFVTWDKIYKRKILVENNIHFPKQRVGEDALFNFSIYKVVNSVYIDTSVILYNYRVRRNGSATSTDGGDHYKNGIEIIHKIEDLCNFWNKKPDYLVSMQVSQVLYAIQNSLILDANSYFFLKSKLNRNKEFLQLRKKIKWKYMYRYINKYSIMIFFIKYPAVHFIFNKFIIIK